MTDTPGSTTPAPAPESAPENPLPHYLGALVTGALVVGLAFFIKDAPTKWIVVATGIVMIVTTLGALGKAMAGQGKRT